jgi:phosphoglucomutase
MDVDATSEQKELLSNLSAEQVKGTELAGEPILERLTEAPGNGQALFGLKVVTQSGWFAARPSGTEAKYKIYAESFRGDAHLEALLREAQELVTDAIGGR